MGNSQDMFKKSFTGYDKQQVEKYINSVTDEEDAKIVEMKEKIKEIVIKNKELLDKIEQIRKDREQNGKTEDYKNFLMERLEKVSEIMLADSKTEIVQMKDEAMERELELDEEINKLNRFFKNVQENLDILIKTVLVKNEQEAEVDNTSKFKLIHYKGRTNNKKMLQNEESQSETQTMKIAQNDIYRADNLDELKNMYIVGKIAGEDIIADTGEKIIAKDAVITQEDVKKAEEAGKLSELIIKMAVPDTDK